MAESSGSGTSMVTGTVAFYKRPEPLAPDRHGTLGVMRMAKPYLFAKTTHVVPLTVGEFSHAGLDYPIIFSGAEHIPIAVMGMRAGENEFIGEDGAFEANRYVPAFIRRYPFVFAEDRPNNRFIACIDVEAPMVVKENPDTKLFEGNEPTQYTREAVNFLTGFEQQRRDTQEFVKRLNELDLFETAKVSVRPQQSDGTAGDPVDVAEYTAVSFDKLKALPPETLAELLASGHLAAIFIHLHSLRVWQWLIERAGRRAQARTPEPAAVN